MSILAFLTMSGTTGITDAAYLGDFTLFDHKIEKLAELSWNNRNVSTGINIHFNRHNPVCLLQFNHCNRS